MRMELDALNGIHWWGPEGEHADDPTLLFSDQEVVYQENKVNISTAA